MHAIKHITFTRHIMDSSYSPVYVAFFKLLKPPFELFFWGGGGLDSNLAAKREVETFLFHFIK